MKCTELLFFLSMLSSLNMAVRGEGHMEESRAGEPRPGKHETFGAFGLKDRQSREDRNSSFGNNRVIYPHSGDMELVREDFGGREYIKGDQNKGKKKKGPINWIKAKLGIGKNKDKKGTEEGDENREKPIDPTKNMDMVVDEQYQRKCYARRGASCSIPEPVMQHSSGGRGNKNGKPRNRHQKYVPSEDEETYDGQEHNNRRGPKPGNKEKDVSSEDEEHNFGGQEHNNRHRPKPGK
ncbi:unnamed protein product [Cylicocyclus nassatus]|uniref:Uncharacterized protein n=1 Tax=Cylicocyclus nassatus TaxID=53992 RepID=A0AA36M581_CYLNA|nr:unnamed protein product [Cylicocyclus nassatus]